MQVIPNVDTKDNFDKALTIEDRDATLLAFIVANASAIVRLRPSRRESGGDQSYGPEVLLTPQTQPVPNVSGAMFRSAVAGVPARVQATLVGPDDPQLTAGIPFPGILAASGEVTAASSVSAHACIQDQQPSGTNESSAAGVGAWATRTLNTILGDTSAIVKALAANRFTLGAGTYVIEATVPCYQTGRAQARLRNITAGATVLGGTSLLVTASGVGSYSIIKGSFAIAADTDFEIQMRCALSDAAGFGVGVGLSFAPDPVEIFTTLDLWKVG